METELRFLRQQLQQRIGQREVARAQIEQEKDRLANAKQEAVDVKTVQGHLQDIAQQVQQEAHKQLTKVVSRCLSAVFQEPYELKVEFKQLRGRTEAEFVYRRRGKKVNPLLDSGGVLDVTAMALRLSKMMMSIPTTRKFLCLDEPFRCLAGKNVKKMAALIETLHKDLGVQFLIATHSEHLQVGNIYEL